YFDDWGIHAHTPELRIVQSLRDDDTAWMRLRYRYYRQTAADFYRDIYDAPQAYMTDDPKLSAFTTHTVGLQLATELDNLQLGFTGSLGDARLELVVEYLQQNNRFGNAVVGQLALTLPLRY